MTALKKLRLSLGIYLTGCFAGLLLVDKMISLPSSFIL